MAARETSGSARLEAGELPQQAVARLDLQIAHLPLPLGGQVDRAATAVARVDAALEHAALLEVVEQSDHRARVHACERCQLLLGDPGALRDDGHQPELARVEAVRLEDGDEAMPRLLAEIAEEEPGVPRQLLWGRVCVEHSHSTLTCSANRL